MPTADDLSRFAVFSDIDGAALQQLASLGEVLNMASGEVVFREGDVATHLYLLVEGSIQATKQNSQGQAVTIHKLSAGDFAGLTGLFIDKRRSATLTALSACTLWRIAKSDIHGLLEEHKDLATSLIRYLSLRYRSDARNIAEVPTHSDVPQDKAQIAVFDSKPYDIKSFDGACIDGVSLRYIEPRLGPETAILANGCRVVVAFVNDILDAATIERLAECGVELIAMRCAGFNNVDLIAARKAQMRVVRVPAYSPFAVAEHGFGLLLAINRRIHRAWNRVRDGNFQLNGLVGFDLHGRTLGVLGTGTIGKCMARIGKGFGMKILGWDVYPDEAFAQEVGMTYCEKEEVLAQSHVVSLHTPLLPSTHHLIDRQAVQTMQKGAILINTSRGGLVDTDALIEGIISKHLGGAGLDVYEEEADYFFEDHSTAPIQDAVLSRLISLPNVIVTSHQAFLTIEALTNIANTTFESIDAFLHDNELVNEVTGTN